MAKSRQGLMSGMIGDRIYRVRNGKQTVYAAPESYRQPNSEAQMTLRGKWANVIALYRALKPFAALCFEREEGGANPYHRFISVNMQKPEVYITKQINNMRGGVVAPYWVSQGCLDAIAVAGRGREAVTDIALGGLDITTETTVGGLAEAVVTHNERFEYDDRLLFLYFRQLTEELSGTPVVSASCRSVTLAKDDPTPLVEAGGSTGFASREGLLSVADTELPDGGFCWVHTRETTGGKLLVSPQRLIDNNPLLARYMSDEARLASMQSYGLRQAALITPERE